MLKICSFQRFFIISIIILFRQNLTFIKSSIKSSDHSTSINDDTNKHIYFRKLNDCQKKNLVIGAFTHYSWIEIKYFIISLIHVKFENCDYVMFVGRTTQNTKDKLKLLGITVYDIPDELIGYKIQNSRWKIYEDFLNNNKDKYNMVFTADIKDSFFQKDIFKFYDYNKPILGLFYEDSIIKNSSKDCEQIIFYSGQENLERIYLNRIICSGTVIGTTGKFIEFCKILWEIMQEKNDLINIRDQGAVNYIIYYLKYFNDCLITKDNSGPLMTIGSTKRENIKLDKDDNVINFQGEIAAVVHQYNRHEDIVNKINNIFNEYNLEINLSNYKNNDNSFIIQENISTQPKEGFVKNYILVKGNYFFLFIKIVVFIFLTYFIIVFRKYLFKSFKRNKSLFHKGKRKFKKVKIKIFES